MIKTAKAIVHNLLGKRINALQRISMTTCNFKHKYLRRWHKRYTKNMRTPFSRQRWNFFVRSCVFKKVMKPLLRIQSELLSFFFSLASCVLVYPQIFNSVWDSLEIAQNPVAISSHRLPNIQSAYTCLSRCIHMASEIIHRHVPSLGASDFSGRSSLFSTDWCRVQMNRHKAVYPRF